jgi:hypothetical protein
LDDDPKAGIQSLHGCTPLTVCTQHIAINLCVFVI